MILSKYQLATYAIIFYFYSIIFSGWLMKLASIPNDIGLLVLSFFDLFPLFLFICFNPVLNINSVDIGFNSFKFWCLIFFVLLILIISTIYQGGTIVPCIAHWGAIIRFIPLSYFVYRVHLFYDISSVLLKNLRIMFVILLFISILCVFLGNYASIFLPLLPNGATAAKELVNGAYAGIFPNTIDLAFALLLLYIINIYSNNLTSVKVFFITLLTGYAIFKTGSAISTLVYIWIAWFRITNNHKNIRYFIMVVVLFILVYFAYKYWHLIILLIENVKLSRLGILTSTLPNFLNEFSFDTLIGMGCDGFVVLDKVNGYKDKVHLLAVAKNGNISAFGDVYWVALLVYHGLIGFLLLIYMFFKLFKTLLKNKYIDDRYNYSQIIKWIIFSIIIIGFLNQIVVVKSFSIILWLFLGVIYSKIKLSHENITNK